MKLFITGASGLLGAHITKLAMDEGREITINYRSKNKRSYLSSISSSRIVECCFDLTLNEEYPDSIDTDIVINCAAFASALPADKDKMYEINVEAVKRLYSLCIKSGVKKFVQISSSACLGSQHKEEIIDESKSDSPRDTSYAKSKSEIDNWLEKQTDIPVLFIHPGYMLGAWDAKPSSGAVFFALKMNKINQYKNSLKNFVAASDVARGVLQAVDHGVGGHFILGGENRRISDFLKTYSDISGESVEQIKEKVYLSDDNSFAQEFCDTQGLDDSKARAVFGYKPMKDLEDMIEEALVYFYKHKMLRSSKR